MTTRISSALVALAGLLLLPALLAPAASATVTAHLRVLTPNKVLDPGTDLHRGRGRHRADPARRRLLRGPGWLGRRVHVRQAQRAQPACHGGPHDGARLAALLTDQFGFGLGICGIGGREAEAGESFWYFKTDHQESTVGADQQEISDGDAVLFYLAPDRFPSRTPPSSSSGRRPVSRPASRSRPRSSSIRASPTRTRSRPPARAARPPTRPSRAATTLTTTGADGKAEVTVDDARRGDPGRDPRHRYPGRGARHVRGPGRELVSGRARDRPRGKPAGRSDQRDRRRRRDPLAGRRRQHRPARGRRGHRQLRPGRRQGPRPSASRDDADRTSRPAASGSRDDDLAPQPRWPRRRSRSPPRPPVAASGPGESSEGEATLTVTRDYGAEPVLEVSEQDPAETETVIRFLDREAEITTRYGGGFVQSIDGTAGRGRGRALQRLVLLRQRDRVRPRRRPRFRCAAATGSGGTTATGPTRCGSRRWSARGPSPSPRPRPPAPTGSRSRSSASAPRPPATRSPRCSPARASRRRSSSPGEAGGDALAAAGRPWERVRADPVAATDRGRAGGERRLRRLRAASAAVAVCSRSTVAAESPGEDDSEARAWSRRCARARTRRPGSSPAPTRPGSTPRSSCSATTSPTATRSPPTAAAPRSPLPVEPGTG